MPTQSEGLGHDSIMQIIKSLNQSYTSQGESKTEFDEETGKQAVEYFEKFVTGRDRLESRLSALSQNWSKTPDITKALLLALLLEIESSREDLTIPTVQKRLIGNYLRLAQDYIDGAAVSLVHALVLKLLEGEK